MATTPAFELNKEFILSLQEALTANNSEGIKELIAPLHNVEIAEIVHELELEESKKLFEFIAEEDAAEVLIELDEDLRNEILSSLSSKEIASRFIDYLETDDAADVVADLPEKTKAEVLSHLEDIEQASDIVDLLNYEEGTAGALMAKEFISVRESWSVAQCIREMRKQAEEISHVYNIYVVNENDVLLGTLSLKSFLYVSPRSYIKEIINKEIKSVKTSDSSEEVASIMERYDLVAMPVVDELGRLVGRITIDDVVDVMKEEAEKDYQMASGLSENVESTDKVWILSRARLPWLLIGLVGGVLGSKVIGAYEDQIQIYPEMAFFIPLIAAMGGNAGVQSSAIIVQGLANKSLGFDGVGYRLLKETRVAILNGLVCSLLLLAYHYFFGDSIMLSLTISTALMTVIVIATLFGSIIPLMLDKYKIDPALATGPFITTINDIFGLIIYFSIGRMMYIG